MREEWLYSLVIRTEMQNLIFPGKQVAAFGGKGVAQGPTEVIMRVGKRAGTW